MGLPPFLRLEQTVPDDRASVARYRGLRGPLGVPYGEDRLRAYRNTGGSMTPEPIAALRKGIARETQKAVGDWEKAEGRRL
jgi:hypothetical protein